MNKNLISAQRKGGAVMAVRQRQAALQRYYDNPNKCKNCNKIIPVLPGNLVHEIRSKRFCNSSCAAVYNNQRKTKGTRIAKLEIWLQTQLTACYPDLVFHFNRKDTIGGELDIYIPKLKLAFELNGIFHYEPIYGKEKLKRIQSNDGRKMQACLERGVELCLIDTSQQDYFRTETATKFLTIIQNIIALKL